MRACWIKISWYVRRKLNYSYTLIFLSYPYGITGSVQPVIPAWGPEGFDPSNAGGVASHHIAAGILGIIAGLFHLTVRPPQRLYKVLRMGNIETVLSSSIAAVFWCAFVVSGTMWYVAYRLFLLLDFLYLETRNAVILNLNQGF